MQSENTQAIANLDEKMRPWRLRIYLACSYGLPILFYGVVAPLLGKICGGEFYFSTFSATYKDPELYIKVALSTIGILVVWNTIGAFLVARVRSDSAWIAISAIFGFPLVICDVWIMLALTFLPIISHH